MKRLYLIIRKWTILFAIIIGSGFLLFKGLQYRLQYDVLPLGTFMAGLDVSGLTREEAKDLLEDSYYGPIFLYHVEDHVQLNPQDVGFSLDLDGMFLDLDKKLSESSSWLKFLNFVIKRPLKTIDVPLMAEHDPEGLAAMIESVSEFLDKPATPPRMLGVGGKLAVGSEGYVTDVESSIAAVEKALYSLTERDVDLAIIRQAIPERNMELLEEAIRGEMQSFDGLGSIFIMDLSSGEELAINANVAVSGLSVLKIAIFVDAFRAIDGPLNDYQKQLFLDTATRSSNFSANLLLHEVAGESNTYKGADILTEDMRNLGLENTFMAVPYDASPPAYRRTTYVTVANSNTELTTEPDPTMQSTAEEIGTLLSMIYYCAQGGGTLIALYPDQITPEECQNIIDFMVLNEEGNLIRFGVPPDTVVSHKHGWARATHADAGIVFSPGGDFVIVEYLYQPGEWLLAEESFPVMREIARAAYNYFNMDNPFLSDELANRGFIDSANPFSEVQNDQKEAGTTTPEATDSGPETAPEDGNEGADGGT